MWRIVSPEVSLDRWHEMKYNGVEWFLVRFNCLELQIIDGMKLNMMESIPFKFIQISVFLFHPIWDVCDGMTHF